MSGGGDCVKSVRAFEAKESADAWDMESQLFVFTVRKVRHRLEAP